MKPLSRSGHAAAISLILAAALPSSAVVFTNDTHIAFDDPTYDGSEIVVSNCVVTVDGPHAFTGLQVLGAGVLTHSYAPNGFPQVIHVNYEPEVLTGTNAVMLANTNVILSSVVVAIQTTVYTNGIDYIVSTDTSGHALLQRTPDSTIPDPPIFEDWLQTALSCSARRIPRFLILPRCWSITTTTGAFRPG